MWVCSQNRNISWNLVRLHTQALLLACEVAPIAHGHVVEFQGNYWDMKGLAGECHLGRVCYASYKLYLLTMQDSESERRCQLLVKTVVLLQKLLGNMA